MKITVFSARYNPELSFAEDEEPREESTGSYRWEGNRLLNQLPYSETTFKSFPHSRLNEFDGIDQVLTPGEAVPSDTLVLWSPFADTILTRVVGGVPQPLSKQAVKVRKHLALADLSPTFMDADSVFVDAYDLSAQGKVRLDRGRILFVALAHGDDIEPEQVRIFGEVGIKAMLGEGRPDGQAAIGYGDGKRRLEDGGIADDHLIKRTTRPAVDIQAHGEVKVYAALAQGHDPPFAE